MKFVADAADIVRGAKMSMWSNLAHVDQNGSTWHNCLSCGAILSCGAMTNCSTSAMWSNLSLLHMTNSFFLPFCDLRCFDAKSISLRFTPFCVEQKLTQTSCPWSKNDKFHVWYYICFKSCRVLIYQGSTSWKKKLMFVLFSTHVILWLTKTPQWDEGSAEGPASC